MRIPSAYWFGLTLLSGLLFLWCLVSAIEAETVGAAWVWGLIVFGLILIIVFPQLVLWLPKVMGG